MKISFANVLPAAAAALLLLLASGCALSGISPFAYPHFWDFTGSEPKQSDLVGTYVVLKISGSPPSFHSTGNVRVILNSDHTASLSGIPNTMDSAKNYFAPDSHPGLGNCTVVANGPSTSGRMRLVKPKQGWRNAMF